MGKNCAVIGCSNSTVKIYKWRIMPFVVHEGKIRKGCGCWLDPPYKLFCLPSQLKYLKKEVDKMLEKRKQGQIGMESWC